ncbi:MAG TPA: hypothetical protein VM344_04485, partial [Vitreimonas sp.]|nr:hypothetical protein [Vitreimonas sp.]
MTAPAAYVPPDPRALVDGPLDPALEDIREELRPHSRRLWLRRIVRRAWMAVAVVVGAELLLWSAARVVPIESAPMLGAGLPVLGLLGLLAAAVACRPGLGETALALDAEAQLGDRMTSALALAAATPAAAGPADDSESALPVEAAQERRFIRRQRQDALAALRTAPSRLFRPRLSRQPAAATLIAMLILAPVVLLPNPQDVVIERNQQIRAEADRQADRIDEIADELEKAGAEVNDPRTQLAEELRELARQLRQSPEHLDLNLARIASLEGRVRAQLDPANEQRASALTSLSRSLSRTATGQQNANRDGDPDAAARDLADLRDKLDELTPEQLRDLARQLAEQQSTAAQADGAAGQALRDAAQSLGQGDAAGAREALDRLGEALRNAGGRVDTNRDIARAASRLQDARRELADSGRPGQGDRGQTGQNGNQGQGNQGQGQGN